MNDSLDDNEEVHSKESKEKSKDIESHPAYFILSYPLGNQITEKVVFTYDSDSRNFNNNQVLAHLFISCSF